MIALTEVAFCVNFGVKRNEQERTPMSNNTTPDILWRTKYATAYEENGRMVIRYRFPYSRQREAELLGCFHLTPEERLPYYQTLSAILERNLMLTDYLAEQGVPSILTFDSAYQSQEDNGIICVYCIPPVPVTPITRSLFAEDCNALTVLDVFLRLSRIQRDINKSPISPVLRYLDMDDVYLTPDNKILLGGFFYAEANGLPTPPDYLPDAAAVVTQDQLSGLPTTEGTDMRILCRIMWNVFSGLPWDTAQTTASMRIPPLYAPAPLLSLLELGLTGECDNCASFRKKILQCRKELAKTEFAEMTIPFCIPYRREFRFPTERKKDTADSPAPAGDTEEKR